MSKSSFTSEELLYAQWRKEQKRLEQQEIKPSSRGRGDFQGFRSDQELETSHSYHSKIQTKISDYDERKRRESRQKANREPETDEWGRIRRSLKTCTELTDHSDRYRGKNRSRSRSRERERVRSKSRDNLHERGQSRDRFRYRSPTKQQKPWKHDRFDWEDSPSPESREKTLGDYRPPSPTWISRAGGVAIMKKKLSTPPSSPLRESKQSTIFKKK